MPRVPPAPASVSVLIPTWQGAEFLESVLVALAAQRLDRTWDLRVVDSGSTDGTLAILERHRSEFPVPFTVDAIDQVEFDHGDTRNLLAARSAGELCVFLTQDAIPSSPDWLGTLVANFDDPMIGAAYCKNVPRPDARPATRALSRTDPGYREGREVVQLPADYDELDAHARRVLYNFNDVASAIRRELWERHPFPRTRFGEDVLMARALLEGGWKIAYDSEATVEHSHDYDEHQTRARAVIDGRFNAEWLDRVAMRSEDVEATVERFAADDARALAEQGLSDGELADAQAELARLRRAAFEGLAEGARSLRRFPRTRCLERTTAKILYVIHGFPPDTWAGTEVYTLNLAREMIARGHEAVVFTRAPAVGDEPDFSLREDEIEGLRVVRMTQRLAHPNVRASYHEPRAEAVFRDVCRRERPDVVHFQHLIHLSAGLVHVARELGLPTIVHLHDYWAACARVQLIRPDGRVCPENMGAGCHPCVHERGLSQVERLRRLGEERPELVEQLARGDHPRRGPGRAGPRWAGLGDLLARREFVPDAYRAADLRISPSRFLRRLLVDAEGFDAHTTLFSDNGMRTDHVRALEKRPAPDGRVRFGFVGTLVWYKGDELLIRAMNRLAGTNAALFVYGDFRPDDVPEHARLAELSRAGNVEFLGRFDNQRLSEVYAEIDVLVVPSLWYENSPITIHEAFLTRTPVVASRLGGMAEYVRDGVDGLCFEPGDDEDLARVLRRFVDEPGLVDELSRDWMSVKTIADNAVETEFRYRQLLALERPAGPRLLARVGAPATSERAGAVELQGSELLLLRLGARVEYRLDGLPNALCELTVELLALGGETAVALGGAVELDGAALGTIEPKPSGGEDEVRRYSFRFRTEAATATVALSADAAFLRIRAVEVHDVSAADPSDAPLS